VAAPVSVIIAALNEERKIEAAVKSAFDAGAAEVIVSDGGSRDATRAIAASAGARVIDCEPMRSRQFNGGANAARHESLVFLHADTTLPHGAAAAIDAALHSAGFGGFRISFAEPAAKLRLVAALINIRTEITRCPWGDQAQYLRRSTFLRDGGFREIPLMEDYELAVRMKRRGRSVVLPLAVVTSGRRFLDKGLLRTAALNWYIVARWRLGADAATLARIYRS
jgi:rSAM/selenodomain-associated transferase 2